MKLFIKHDNLPYLLKNGKPIKINDTNLILIFLHLFIHRRTIFVIFSRQRATVLNYGYFGQAESTVPVWYTDVFCVGTESSLEQCSRQNYGTLPHYYDVGVNCSIGNFYVDILAQWCNV